jgi:hypothetical protein
VSLIFGPLLLSDQTERLTRTRSRPDGSIVGPSCESQGVAPSADTGEEVALRVSAQIVGLDIDDGSPVNVTWSDVSGSD